MLDFESEVMRGPGSIPIGGNIFHWISFVLRSKASDGYIRIITNPNSFMKNSTAHHKSHPPHLY